MKKNWRFYVYEITSDDGSVIYVGKGSGRRSSVSAREKGGADRIVAFFNKEKDAYDYEIERISEVGPAMNKHPGGNGSRAAKVRKEKNGKWESFVEKVGTKRYAAMLLLGYAKLGYPVSKLDDIRRVAYGYGA